MVERLRALAEHPLDPRAARAAIVLAAAIFAGLAVLILLAGSERGRPPQAQGGLASRPGLAAPPPMPAQAPRIARPRTALDRRGKTPAQDPQDRRGSADARRAARELADHRALQHVPYRRARLSIQLVGAKGRRAVLAVSAPTLSAAHRGWQRFLRRYRDDGRAYLPRFKAEGGQGG